MKKNMGKTDRMIRLIIAVVAAILYFTGTIAGTLGLVALIVSVIFVLTSLISFCPLYKLLGLSSTKGK